MTENLILVDEFDNEVGSKEKLEVHQLGLLHRAFSVFVFNDKGEILLQKRNSSKYHSGGLWTNTCCGHPRPKELVADAAKRRLFEEMGFETILTKKFDFIYNAKFDNGLVENEFDHVFCGTFNQTPLPNALEVEDWKYVNWEWLMKDINLHPNHYTVWFKICLEKIDITTFLK
jgi:isopentenyl-diphosphate delta-isomerase